MMAPFTVFFSPGFHLPKTFHVFGSDLSVDVVRCRQWLRLSSVNGLLVFGFHCCLRWLFLRSLPSPEPTYRLCFSSPHPSCFCATQKQPPPSSDDEAQAELSDDAGGDVPDADQEAWSPGDDGEEGGQEGGEEDQAATDVAVKRVTRATAIATATARPPVTSKELFAATVKARKSDPPNRGRARHRLMALQPSLRQLTPNQSTKRTPWSSKRRAVRTHIFQSTLFLILPLFLILNDLPLYLMLLKMFCSGFSDLPLFFTSSQIPLFFTYHIL